MTTPLAATVTSGLDRRHRWQPWEIAVWLSALAAYLLLPDKHLLINEIAILALFALSLDLILGYAGIVSLGHAAFLGTGAYAAGLFAKHVNADPLTGLVVGTAAATVIGFASSFLVLRGNDLTRLMITLGIGLILLETANQMSWLTGGSDGLQGVTIAPLLGQFPFGIRNRGNATAYSLVTLFVLFLLARRIMHSPFGMSLEAIRDNPQRAAAIGIPVSSRLVAIYTLSAAYAGAAGALLAQTSQYAALDWLSFERSADVMLVLIIGGAGYLYGGIFGAVVFVILRDGLSTITPQHWHFWVGLILVLIVLADRNRIARGLAASLAALRRRASSGGDAAP